MVPETDGGYVVSGRWGFGSGGGHSDWLYMPILVMEDGAPNVRFCFAPRSEFTIEDTWHVLGMRGTGSNTMVADGVFVPEHRTYPLLGPNGAMNGVTRKGHQDEELYRCPFGMIGGATLCGTFLGIGEAAFDHLAATLPTRPISYSNYLTSSSSVGTQLDIAEAAIQNAGNQIRCNAVCPGVTQTPILGDISDELLAAISGITPMGRLGQPEDIAGLIGYLLSPASAFMTGQAIAICGGFSVQ